MQQRAPSARPWRTLLHTSHGLAVAFVRLRPGIRASTGLINYQKKKQGFRMHC
jgi:hypothetical protein